MTETEILERLRWMGGYHGVFVPQFTFGIYRIDAVIIDVKHRWVRGFEIKTSRADFLRDNKFSEYSSFLSSISLVCPEGIIEKKDLEGPAGLMWITNDKYGHYLKWIKRPRPLQSRRNLAWLWTYVQVIEKELPRLYLESQTLRQQARTTP